MKNINIILSSLVLLTCFSQAAFCVQSSALSSKIKLQDSSTMSKRANGEEGLTASPLSDPFINSTLGGMSNMIQGMTDHPYSLQEQQRAQMDYAKQQMEQMKEMDAE